MMTVREKLAALRKVMKSRKVAALVVPSADPHQSEYVAPHWKSRMWVSGFTGSAGTLVVTADKAALWGDGRYFVQAEQELRGTRIKLFKSREPGVPTVNEWIARQLKPGQTVAFDGRLFTVEAVREMKTVFAPKHLCLHTSEDFVGLIWKDRPALPCSGVIDFPVSYAGANRATKLKAVRDHLAGKKADFLLLASLDDIAWLFNLRGGDIAHTPVVLAYALVGMRNAILFADPDKFSVSLKRKLAQSGIRIVAYGKVERQLRALPATKSLCFNPRRISQQLIDSLPKHVHCIEETPDITTSLKSVKNRVEQNRFREAALWDGIAMTRFMAWLDRTIKAGKRVTEYDAGAKLAMLRMEVAGCRGESFDVITGYRANGAIIHYKASAEKAAKLSASGLFLVDSGGQYWAGTMDTTRTLALGPVSYEARLNYTRVLKGLLLLSRCRFPAGTTGTHLDILGRLPLWAEGLNYRHGSGHGVGSYLCVHEGPQGFTQMWSPCSLKPGMVMTIEPGFYRAGEYGVRIENMVLVTSDRITEYGDFMKFETLTRCPIDIDPVIVENLTPDEQDWLNDYHRQVWETLSPHLDKVDQEWLRRKTRALGER